MSMETLWPTTSSIPYPKSTSQARLSSCTVPAASIMITPSAVASMRARRWPARLERATARRYRPMAMAAIHTVATARPRLEMASQGVAVAEWAA